MRGLLAAIYVNIDDTWEGERDAQGVHPRQQQVSRHEGAGGLCPLEGPEAGIYSSPGPKTCARYAGSYQHEEQDAKTYASWGIDYLKYDLCSWARYSKKEANGDRAKYFALEKAAYEKMHQALVDREADRLQPVPVRLRRCVGVGAVVGGNLWRTTGDISDHYDRMSVIGFAVRAGKVCRAGPLERSRHA
jgi:alpha-galactosidase